MRGFYTFLILLLQVLMGSAYADPTPECDDYFTTVLNNPVDMSDSSDINRFVGYADISDMNSMSFSGGVFSATAATNNPYFHLLSPKICGSYELGGRYGQNYPIDSSKYSKISFRLNADVAGFVQVLWNFGCNYNKSWVISDPIFTSTGWGVYEVDLNSAGKNQCVLENGTVSSGSGCPNWSDQEITGIRVDPTPYSGTNFQIDWIRLEDASCAVDSDDYNHQPLIEILEPNNRGGARLRDWDMSTTFDIVGHDNVTTAEILPDNTVQGVVGDFFHGINTEGNLDPVNYSTFPFGVDDPITFSASEYRYLCFKLFIDRAIDVGAGSVARVIWQDTTNTFHTGEDLVTVFDGWSENESDWAEYCLDLTDMEIEEGSTAWGSGTIQAFRLDAHEFSTATDYYIDHIYLAKMDSADQQFAITYNLSDSDDVASVTFYYNTSKSSTGWTMIGSASESDGHVYLWDTSAISAGTYYVAAVASDGVNSVTRWSDAPLSIAHSGAALIGDPYTELSEIITVNRECPTEGAIFDGTFQAMFNYQMSKPFALAQMYINDTLVETLYLADGDQVYSREAKEAGSSSNSGLFFNTAASNFSFGANIVKVRVYNTDGDYGENSFALTRTASQAALSCGVTALESAGQTVPDLGGADSAKVIQTKHNSEAAKFSVSDVGSAGCTIKMQASQTEDGTFEDLKQFTVSSSQDTKNLIKFIVKAKTKNVTADLKASGYWLRAVKSCDGVTTVGDGKKVKMGPKSAPKSKFDYAKLLARLKQKLKVDTGAKAKKKNKK